MIVIVYCVALTLGLCLYWILHTEPARSFLVVTPANANECDPTPCSSREYCTSSSEHSENPQGNITLTSHSSSDGNSRIGTPMEFPLEGGGGSATADQLSHEVVLLDPPSPRSRCAPLQLDETATLQMHSSRLQLSRQQSSTRESCPQLTGVCTGCRSSFHIDEMTGLVAVSPSRMNLNGSSGSMSTQVTRQLQHNHTTYCQQQQQDELHLQTWPTSRRVARAGTVSAAAAPVRIRGSSSLMELSGTCSVTEGRLRCGSASGSCTSVGGSVLRLSGPRCGRPARLLHSAGSGPDTLVTANGVTLLQQAGEQSTSSGSITESIESEVSHPSKELGMTRWQQSCEGHNNNILEERCSNMLELTTRNGSADAPNESIRRGAKRARRTALQQEQQPVPNKAACAVRRGRQFQKASSDETGSMSPKSALQNSVDYDEHHHQPPFRDEAGVRAARATIAGGRRSAESGCNASGPLCKLRPPLAPLPPPQSAVVLHSSLSMWSSRQQRHYELPQKYDTCGNFQLLPNQGTVTADYVIHNNKNNNSNPHRHRNVWSRRSSTPLNVEEPSSLLATECHPTPEELSNKVSIANGYHSNIFDSHRLTNNTALNGINLPVGPSGTGTSSCQHPLTAAMGRSDAGSSMPMSRRHRTDQTKNAAKRTRPVKESTVVNIEETCELLDSMDTMSS